MFCRFPPGGNDVPFAITSSTSMVLVLFRTDVSVVALGFNASLALKSSGENGPFPILPDPNLIKFSAYGKPTNPLPYPFDASGD
jgi:hypothetical protein